MTVYSLTEEIDEELIKEKATESFVDSALVTVKFVSVYTELDEDSRVRFMIGLMLTLMKEGEMPEEL